jgi:hypothetical protein
MTLSRSTSELFCFVGERSESKQAHSATSTSVLASFFSASRMVVVVSLLIDSSVIVISLVIVSLIVDSEVVDSLVLVIDSSVMVLLV